MKLIRNYEESVAKKVELELEKLLAMSQTDKDICSTPFSCVRESGFRFHSIHNFIPEQNELDDYLYVFENRSSDEIVILRSSERIIEDAPESSWTGRKFFKPEDYKKVAVKVLDFFGLNEYGFKS